MTEKVVKEGLLDEASVRLTCMNIKYSLCEFISEVVSGTHFRKRNSRVAKKCVGGVTGLPALNVLLSTYYTYEYQCDLEVKRHLIVN